jgi:GT2 family glycosyltransferase
MRRFAITPHEDLAAARIATRNQPMPMKSHIAALLTCHNRRTATVASLRLLFAQELDDSVQLAVFLVDDGSSDETGAAVASEFPQVRLLRGDGNLYWTGGMRKAFAEALQENFDYYMWLNDDVLLDPGAVQHLLITHRRLATIGENRSIVVGSTRDPETGSLTYGGVERASRIHPFKFRLVPPGKVAQPCATMNGNIVMIPRSVAETVGNISNAFTHSMGDFDYGLRARRLGCSIWVAPEYVASCRRNGIGNTWQDTSLPFAAWLRKTASAKGLPPGDYKSFAQAHAGVCWPLFWLMPYLRVFLARLFLKSAKATHPANS